MSLLEDFDEFQVRRSRWHDAIDEARTPEEVVTIMRDYLASVTPAELAHLPEKCRPTRIKAEDDITYWTFVLAQYQCRPEQARLDLFQDMLNHFLHASMRISDIRKTPLARRTGPGLNPA